MSLYRRYYPHASVSFAFGILLSYENIYSQYRERVLPFTQSQVLKVKLNNLTPGDPEYAVLKLFDRRFFERPLHPWDQSKEDALLQNQELFQNRGNRLRASPLPFRAPSYRGAMRWFMSRTTRVPGFLGEVPASY
jgi:hypothetical protein